MKKRLLTVLMAPILLLIVASASHANFGSYIDCIHACPPHLIT